MRISRRKLLRYVAALAGGVTTNLIATGKAAAEAELAPKVPPPAPPQKAAKAAQAIRGVNAAKSNNAKPAARPATSTPAKTHPPAPQSNPTNATQEDSQADDALARSELYAPILMYHHVGGKPGHYNVSIAEFNLQMRWLSDNGYRTVSIDQIAVALRGQGQLPAKPVAITFDDGWRNQLNALPIMQDYGFRGTFYLVANYITPKGGYFMGWNEVEILLKYGHWLGSHSGQHLPETRFSGAALMNDVTAARTVIQQQLGVTVTSHAYPYGISNAAVTRAVANAGYSAAAGVWGRATQSLGQIYNLHRLDARGGITTAQFANLMRGIASPRQNKPAPVPSLNEESAETHETPSARLGPDSR